MYPMMRLRRGQLVTVAGVVGAFTLLGFVRKVYEALDEFPTLVYWSCLLGWDLPLHEQSREHRYTRVQLERSPSGGPYQCVPLYVKPSPVICIHDPNKDIFISAAIHDGGTWESELVRTFQHLLRSDEQLGFIDIGANIGQYSLIAAKMGRQVIAVEPYLIHVQMIHKSVTLNNLQKYMTLIYNAVSDNYRTVQLHFKKHNWGAIRIIDTQFNFRKFASPGTQCLSKTSGSHVNTILLDDLVGLATFKKAIMKVDIEGHESRAMIHANNLLAKLFIPFIFMEWEILRMESEEGKVRSVMQLIEFLKTRNYDAYTTSGQPLNQTDWPSWPNDILWKHSEANMDIT